jgi:actin-related protein
MSVIYSKNCVPHHCEQDQTKVVIIDNADHNIKAGIGGERKPSVIFPTMIGYPRRQGGIGTKDEYIGQEAEKMRSVLKITQPIKNDMIYDMGECEKLWGHAFDQLGVDPCEYHVLMTEAPHAAKSRRIKKAEIMFESF